VKAQVACTSSMRHKRRKRNMTQLGQTDVMKKCGAPAMQWIRGLLCPAPPAVLDVMVIGILAQGISMIASSVVLAAEASALPHLGAPTLGLHLACSCQDEACNRASRPAAHHKYAGSTMLLTRA